MKNFKHQTDAIAAGYDKSEFAYFMDPGTGKTRVLLHDAQKNFELGRIDALLVLAPNSVKTSWVAWPHMLEEGEMDQVDTHLGEGPIKGVWMSSGTASDKAAWHKFERGIGEGRQKNLIVLVVNYESLLVPRFYEFLEEFCDKFLTMICADESTRIGKAGSKRTKLATKLAKKCSRRRIMSGTPTIKSPMKIYSQANFLGRGLLGYTSFFPFRNRYCIMGGFEGRQILNHKNLDELADRISKFSYRKVIEDCIDVPDKTFLKRYIDMTPAQMKAYKQMQREFYAEFGDEQITAQIVLTQILRLQQIVGGYITDGDRVIEIVPPSANPRMKEVMDLIDDRDGQVVVWCRFNEEVDGVFGLLQKAGISCAKFVGSVSENDRIRIRKDFLAGHYRVIVGNTQTGGIGIDEFKAADCAIFYSNDFDTEKRRQAEDRIRRIGSDRHKTLTYYDIICPNTVDVKIVRTMRSDAQLSAKVLRDTYKEWI